MKVADGYWKKWNLPNCVGSIDGKHIRIEKPANSGSDFFNYKGFFSIVLMAVVDADYKFLFADIGKQGRISDAGVYNCTSLKEAIESRTINFPDACPLPGTPVTSHRFPFYLAGDDAFALSNHIMKPYAWRNLNPSQRVFNYR